MVKNLMCFAVILETSQAAWLGLRFGVSVFLGGILVAPPVKCSVVVGLGGILQSWRLGYKGKTPEVLGLRGFCRTLSLFGRKRANPSSSGFAG